MDLQGRAEDGGESHFGLHLGVDDAVGIGELVAGGDVVETGGRLIDVERGKGVFVCCYEGVVDGGEGARLGDGGRLGDGIAENGGFFIGGAFEGVPSHEGGEVALRVEVDDEDAQGGVFEQHSCCYVLY